MARAPASPLQLLGEMLSPENDVRRVAEVKYDDWLDQDPDACAAGLLGLCCDVGAGGARLLAFTLLRRVVATRWPGVAVDIRRGAAEAMLAQAFGTTGPSSKAAVETCAALVQQGLGLDDADEDANTLILERCIAAPGHAAALRILERTIQEASPRILGERFPRASACIEAGLASPSSAVAACRAALALTGEVESEPARQHVAKRLVPAVAAILTAAALAGGDGPASEVLTSASLLFDEPLVSWTSFLPAKARALFEVPGAAEALADACGQCVSSESMGDDVRSTALEVLAALLEAAAYWRRDFSYTLAEAVAPLAARAAAKGFRDIDEDAWATRQATRADDDDADDDDDDACADLEAYAPLAAAAAATLSRAANVVGSARLLGSAVTGAVAALTDKPVEEKRAACLVVEVLARDASSDDILDDVGRRICGVLATVAAQDVDAVARDRAFRCLSRLCLAAQPGAAPADDDDYWAGLDDDNDRLLGPVLGRSFAQSFGGRVFPACGAALDAHQNVRVATEAALLLARCCEPRVGAPPPELEAPLATAAAALLAACLPPADDAKLACGARCALALGRLAAVVRSPSSICEALGAALRTLDVPRPLDPEAAPVLSNLVGRLVEAHALSSKACAVANENVNGAVELGGGVCASLLVDRDDGAAHRALQRRVLAAAARYCDAALSSDDDATRVALAARAVDAALADCTRGVACDVFSTLRAARSRAQDQADFEVVTCVSTKEAVKYVVVDAGRLQTHEVAFRAVYEIVKRRRNAAGLDAPAVAARICRALELEWVRFAPTLVSVAAGALSCLAAVADVAATAAPCLCGQVAALNDRCGGAELVSYDADADASDAGADASRAGALRAVEALSLVCEALRDALKATRAADFAATAARALASAARASCARRRERRDLAGESDDDEDDEVGSATQAERDLLECCAAGLAAALARAPAAADVAACIVGVAGPHLGPAEDEDALHRELRAWAICLAAEAVKGGQGALSEPLARACVAAATAPHAALRQAGAWGLGVLADAGAAVPDAPRALVACLAQYPRDGECGASDMAFENTVAAAFRVYARCQDQQLAMAAMGGLPLYLDVAEARPAHATAWALLPDASARRGLQAALAQVAAARPPPGWAVAVLAGDRSARVARRYGNDMGAARAAAQKAVDEAAVVDAATRNALAALV